jgi:hypothetical protein
MGLVGGVSRGGGLCLCRGVPYSVMCVLGGLGYFCYRGRFSRRLLLGCAGFDDG